MLTQECEESEFVSSHDITTVSLSPGEAMSFGFGIIILWGLG